MSNPRYPTVTDLEERFGAKYKVVDDGSNDSDRLERIWCQEIRGQYGAIYPCGLDGSLAVRVEGRRIATRMMGLGYKVRQHGDVEVVFQFPLADFERVAAMIKANKKRQVSDELKTQLLQRLAKRKAAVPKPTRLPFARPEEDTSAATEGRSGG